MGYVLGIDQGGTKTMALVADTSGRILGFGRARGACHTFDGMETAMQAVIEACGNAIAEAGVSPLDILSIKAGMTGADWPHEIVQLERALADAFKYPKTSVVNDCLIARRAGSDAGYGAVLCIGTGLNAAIISPSGQEFVYGYYIADEDGGADAISRQGLRAVFNAEIGLSDPTALRKILLDKYGMSSVDDLVFAYVNKGLGPIKDIAPLLFAAANAGDEVCRDLILTFSKRVSRYVVAGLHRYGMEQDVVDVVLSGSVCSPQNRMLETVVRESITAKAPHVRVINAEYEPVVGAVLMALDEHSGGLFPMCSQLLHESAGRFGLIRSEF